jgi:hypothetical protein
MALGCPVYIRIGLQKIITLQNQWFAESRTLNFVAKNTFFDMFKADNQLYIVMEFIDAPASDILQPEISSDERATDVENLHEFLLQLRALPAPHPGHIPAVDGSDLFDLRFRNKPFGPFHTIGHFNRFLGLEYVQQWLNDLVPIRV